MKLVDRLFDNDWFVASAQATARADVAAELLRAEQAHDVALADVQRAREISPAAVAIALSALNSTQAALGRAQSKAVAAAQCTHVDDGHAFNLTEVRGVTGAQEFVLASCTLGRTATLRPPASGDGWTARLVDPTARFRPATVVSLGPDPEDSFVQACRWIVSGSLQTRPAPSGLDGRASLIHGG